MSDVAYAAIDEPVQMASPSPVESLRALKAVLSDLPHEDLAALAHVQRLRPELVDDGHLLRFLRAEGFDPRVSVFACILLFRRRVVPHFVFCPRNLCCEQRAAMRLLAYWDRRLKVFGEEKFALPLTLSGALKDDLHAIRSGFMVLLPTTDDKGRAIIYTDSASYRKNDLSTDEVRFPVHSASEVRWELLHVVSTKTFDSSVALDRNCVFGGT